jgi:hypothetical protein
VQAKLAGRKIDVIGFIDQLLECATHLGEIRCCLATEQSLRFQLGDQACEVRLDAARGKLRMLCARLAVRCQETAGNAVSPYGGAGTITAPQTHADGWTVRFKNTPDEQQFTVSPVSAPAQAPSAASS